MRMVRFYCFACLSVWSVAENMVKTGNKYPIVQNLAKNTGSLHGESGELMFHCFTSPSVQSFVENAGDYAVRMVNNLLDMLTKGQHSRTNRTLEQVSQTHLTFLTWTTTVNYLSESPTD